jgi:ATP-dependent DNA ligase
LKRDIEAAIPPDPGDARRDGIQLSQHNGRRAAIFRHACSLGFEGIVSKRIGSRYVSGRTRAWLKTKNRIFSGDDRGAGAPFPR